METSVKERIKSFILFKKISVRQFERLCGLSNGYINGIDKTIMPNKISSISLQYPELNTGWLLTGEGNMLKTESPDTSILPFELRDAIPYYENLPVSAGEHGLSDILKDETPTGYMLMPGVHAKGLFPVVGCSMLPVIKPGDVIGINEINRWELVDPGKIYLIVTNEERMIKRLRIDNDDEDILWCVSENYKEFKIAKENIRAIFHVVYHGELL